MIAISEEWIRLISTARRKQSSIENTEVVGKVFLRTLQQHNLFEAERMFCPCGTVTVLAFTG